MGAVLDSDNGAVLEPSLSWSLPFLPGVAGGGVALLALRLWVKALGGLQSQDLNGPAFLVRLVLGPF